MNDASSTLYSEARGLEMPCVCLSDLLAVQEALKRFVAVLQKGHLPLESHRVGLDEAAAEHQLSEGLQPVKVVWEQGRRHASCTVWTKSLGVSSHCWQTSSGRRSAAGWTRPPCSRARLGRPRTRLSTWWRSSWPRRSSPRAVCHAQLVD